MHLVLKICAVLIACVLGFSGCNAELPSEIRKKLAIVADNDFKAIINEMPKKSLADSLYFRIAEYKEFNKGQYRVRAVVEYFYLRDVKVKRAVKYRYVKKAAKWERYANDYITY
jgi:hypothetical protein